MIKIKNTTKKLKIEQMVLEKQCTKVNKFFKLSDGHLSKLNKSFLFNPQKSYSLSFFIKPIKKFKNKEERTALLYKMQNEINQILSQQNSKMRLAAFSVEESLHLDITLTEDPVALEILEIN